jgi:hypothetical protein
MKESSVKQERSVAKGADLFREVEQSLLQYIHVS